MQGYWTQANRKERACADCGNTRFVEDHAAGDVVCAVRCFSVSQGICIGWHLTCLVFAIEYDIR